MATLDSMLSTAGMPIDVRDSRVRQMIGLASEAENTRAFPARTETVHHPTHVFKE